MVFTMPHMVLAVALCLIALGGIAASAALSVTADRGEVPHPGADPLPGRPERFDSVTGMLWPASAAECDAASGIFFDTGDPLGPRLWFPDRMLIQHRMTRNVRLAPGGAFLYSIGHDAITVYDPRVGLDSARSWPTPIGSGDDLVWEDRDHVLVPDAQRGPIRIDVRTGHRERAQVDTSLYRLVAPLLS